MKKFEFFDHTADAKFRAYGVTLEEAFVNAAFATYALITESTQIKSVQTIPIVLSASKKESLLFDFIDQLIFLIDTKGFLLADIKDMKIQEVSSKGEKEGMKSLSPLSSLEKNNSQTQYMLTATLLGDNADAYEVFSAIKAPTYSDMFIKEEQGLVTIQMVHDL